MTRDALVVPLPKCEARRATARRKTSRIIHESFPRSYVGLTQPVRWVVDYQQLDETQIQQQALEALTKASNEAEGGVPGLLGSVAKDPERAKKIFPAETKELIEQKTWTDEQVPASFTQAVEVCSLRLSVVL